MTLLGVRTLILGLVALFAVLLGACSDDKEEPTPTVAPTLAATTAPAEATETVAPAATPTPTTAPPTVTPAPTLTPAEPIAWSTCPDGVFDCAEYDVPLDYSDPAGDTITLAVRRLAAGDANARIGLLFVNPGGPGGSTIDILSAWARSLPSSVRDRFDIVLMDPRGVGHSSPLVCHDNIQELIGLDPYPETDEDWEVIEDAVQRQTSQCETVGGDVLPFLGTPNVARDIDRLREAEGEATITYFGYSYGTTLGQVYAGLFPTHVRAMVLDGGVDVSLTADERALEQTLGFEAAFHRFVDYCAARSCIAGDPETVIKGLVAEAGEEPIPVSRGDRPVGAGEAIYAIVQAMYTPAYRPILSAALNSALDGDASSLLFLADAYSGRTDDGTYGNGAEANAAVNCLDYATDRDPEHHRQISEDFGQAAPFFGPATGQLGLYCAFWPVDPKPIAASPAIGAPPIMVIGGTGDPATPYKWSVALARQLSTAFLVTNDAEGHTSYRSGGPCIDDAVNAYLIDLALPPEGLTCGDAGIAPVPPVP